MFHKEARQFIKSVIKQRQYLINSGTSLKNTNEMEKYIDTLQRQLNFYQYNTDLKMARFFEANQNKIKGLIPVGVHTQKRHNEFETLLLKSLNILINVETKHPDTDPHKNRITVLS